MTAPSGGGAISGALGRRLALTPIGLDVITALAHEPAGLRLTPLAQIIGSPVSSVQAALRILLANRLVRRDGDQPPAYRLADHPARASLIDVSLLLPEPAHAIGLLLRASGAVRYAVVDRDGFVAGLEEVLGGPAHDRLVRSIATISTSRTDAPPVQMASVDELIRLTAVSVGSRARLASAIPLKGRLPARGEQAASRDRDGEPATPEVFAMPSEPPGA